MVASFHLSPGTFEGDLMAAEYGRIMVDNSRVLNQLNKAMGKYSDRIIASR